VTALGGRYELFLRASSPLSEETLHELEAACRAASPPLALEPYRAEGELRGVDLGVDPTEPGSARRLCELAFELARTRALTVFDPQLGRVLSSESESAAVEEQAARGGAFEEGAALSTATSSASTRLWLIVAAVLVGVILLMRFLR
jgi:hypothetical protein